MGPTVTTDEMQCAPQCKPCRVGRDNGSEAPVPQLGDTAGVTAGETAAVMAGETAGETAEEMAEETATRGLVDRLVDRDEEIATTSL